jgi:sigma-B regulation protein RsbU (phosphoserine phosphatase)
MRSDGTEFPVELTITPYRVGGAPRFTAYIRDLTEIVAAENARVGALDRAARHVSAALPADLEDGPVRITGFLRPLDRVGGDFYDFGTVAADTDQVYLYLGDVSGHDVAAALAAMSIHTILRTGASYVDAFGDWQGEIVRPDEVLDGLNEVFPIDSFEGEFFTIWFGVYQVSTRTLHFASAGHPPARTSSGDRLGSSCPPVGMFEDTRYQIHRYVVPSDTHLFVASDGVASRLGNEFMDSFAGAQPTRHHTRKELRHLLFDQLIVPAKDDASMLHVYFA